MLTYGRAVVVSTSGRTGMAVHQARLIALAAVLIGISALAHSTRLHAQQPVNELPLDELRALAEQGDAEAQHYLGVIYYEGQAPTTQDFEEAVRGFRLAVDQGNVAAQSNLGVMYEIGGGVPQDDVEAHMWFNLAAAQSLGQGREEAVEARDGLAWLMTPEQITEAQRRAREWTPTPEPRGDGRPLRGGSRGRQSASSPAAVGSHADA